MVAAACPKCTICLIEANTAYGVDLQTAEVEAVKLGAHIVSNAWICAAPCLSSSNFDTPGVVYLAGSSTSGYGETGEPSAFPSVVSVGGTVLSKSGSTYSESVWSGTGAGCTTATKPSWQHDPDCTTRTVNDISAVALDVAAYDSFGYHGWVTGLGTVVATGLNAGVFGLAGNASSQNAAEKFWTNVQEETQQGAALHQQRQRRVVWRRVSLPGWSQTVRDLLWPRRLGNAQRRQGVLESPHWTQRRPYPIRDRA